MWTRIGLSMLVAGALHAQAPGPVAPGARVRFRVADPQSPEPWARRVLEIRGTVLRLADDSMSVAVGGTAGVVTVSRAGISDLAVSRGVVRRARPSVPLLLQAGSTLLAAA